MRLHSCCMMTCTLNGGPEVGADREGLEARRMPGRHNQQSLQAPGSQQQKFPGNSSPDNSKAPSPVPILRTIMCAMPVNLKLDVPC